MASPRVANEDGGARARRCGTSGSTSSVAVAPDGLPEAPVRKLGGSEAADPEGAPADRAPAGDPAFESPGDYLVLRYVPLRQVRRWERNPKRHDPAIRDSIERHGFGDPPKFDATLGALVYGNGRIEVLEQMRDEGAEAPRGIADTKDETDWLVPVVFGVDAVSVAAAEAFAIDHNSVGLGPGFDFRASLALYDDDALDKIAEDLRKAVDKATEGGVAVPVSFPEGWESVVFPPAPEGKKKRQEVPDGDGVVVELRLSKDAFERLWPKIEPWQEEDGVDVQVVA